jgi:hypothetical protein
MAGKTVSIVLRDNLGTATFNSGAQKIDFPISIPLSRFPKQGIKKKALLANWKGLPSAEERSALSGHGTHVGTTKLLLCSFHDHSPKVIQTPVTFFDDFSSTNRNLDPIGGSSSSNEESFEKARRLFNIQSKFGVGLAWNTRMPGCL